MNELLQRHGCSTVFSIPEGLKELMSDISREVLREQPSKLYDFIANYLSCLLITREHGMLAVKVLDELCDCQPTVSEHLIQIGLEKSQANNMSKIIKKEIEIAEVEGGTAKLREAEIIKKIVDLQPVMSLDEETIGDICQVIRKAYRDYWYRIKLMQKSLKADPQESWEVAAQRTLDVYMKTKPSPHELHVATEKIQAAYKGYYVRKNLLNRIYPPGRAQKSSKPGPEMAMKGPPIDVAGSREIELGAPVKIQVDNDVNDEKAALEYEANEQSKSKANGALSQYQSQGRRHTRLASELPEVIRYQKESSEENPTNHLELTKMISFSEASPEVIGGWALPDEGFLGTPLDIKPSGWTLTRQIVEGTIVTGQARSWQTLTDIHTKAVHQFIRSFGSTNDPAFSSALDVLDIAAASDDNDDN